MAAVSVFDVAVYMLNQRGALSAMKLQKLIYYAQAWAVVWDDEPLFIEPIEAWANGPVVPILYQAHSGCFQVTADQFKGRSTQTLSASQQETVAKVLDFYGDKSAQWLSDQTHSETPWIQAREGLADFDRGNREITLAALAEYYGSL